jgi:hypothetical protein
LRPGSAQQRLRTLRLRRAGDRGVGRHDHHARDAGDARRHAITSPIIASESASTSLRARSGNSRDFDSASAFTGHRPAFDHRAATRASASAARASSAAISGLRISVSTARARRPQRLDVGQLRGVARVEHVAVEQLAVERGDAARRHLVAEPAQQAIGGTLHGRAADDRRDRDDRRARGEQRLADPGHREDRSDRDDRVARAEQDRLGASRSRRARPAPAARAARPRGRRRDVVGRAVAREVFLEVHAAPAREHDVRRAGILRHHEDRAATPSARRSSSAIAPSPPLREPQRAVVAVREVAVAEPEPGLVAERAERLDHRGGVALEPVAARAVDEPASV